MTRERAETFLIVLVALVWAGTFGRAVIDPMFQPDAGVSLALTGVLGLLTASKVRNATKKGGPDG